jgi:TolB protein
MLRDDGTSYRAVDGAPKSRIGAVRRVALLALSMLPAVGCGGSKGLETKTAAPIAFVHSAAIYLTKADGTGRRRVTPRTDEGIGNIAWSPDARKIAYDSTGGILVVSVDGGDPRLLSRTGFELRPAWSPDGRKIAFDQNVDGYSSIWVVDAGGGHVRRLTPGIHFGGPVWSRDGQRMLLTHRYRGLYAIKVDADGQQRPVPVQGGGQVVGEWKFGQSSTSVAWSPDGKQIAFVTHTDVWVMNADGSKKRRLVHGRDRTIRDIAWSPDGRRLAMTRHDGDWEIFVANVDSGGLRNLTDNERVWDRDPSWSPDGRAIAFTSDRDGNGEIYVMNADGSAERNLSRSLAEDLSPVWAPKR